MKRFSSTINNISEWAGKGPSFVLLLATLVVLYGVTRRYAFDSPANWELELTIYLCSITYLLGGAFAHRYNTHVKVDILYLRMTPRVRAIIDLCTSLLFFAGVGLLLWQGTEWTYKAIMGGVTSGSIWDPIIWPVRMLIPVGALLLLLQGIVKFIRDLRIARTGIDIAVDRGTGYGD